MLFRPVSTYSKNFFPYAFLLMLFVFLLPTIAKAESKSNDAGALRLIQSARIETLAPFQETSFGIGFKNTGTSVWRTGGSDVLTLRSGAKKESYFYDASWRGKNTVMTLPRDTKPGELAYFWFTLEAPKEEGIYTEELTLYRGQEKLTHTVTRIPITVTKQARVESSAARAPSVQTVAAHSEPAPLPAVSSPRQEPQNTSIESGGGTVSALKLITSSPSVTLKQAERTAFGIGFKNTGTAAWKKGDPMPLVLRSSAKKESYFYDPSWKSQNSIMGVPQDVQPGELVYFWFTLYAPIYPGTYEERIFLTKNDVKVAGSDVTIPITIVPTSATVLASASGQEPPSADIPLAVPAADVPIDSSQTISPPGQPPRNGIIDERTEQEPLIRVGLFSTKEPVRITANKEYEVRDSDGGLLTIEQAGSVSTVLFDWSMKAYTLTTSKVSLGTIKYLRFGPVISGTPANQSPAQEPTTPSTGGPLQSNSTFPMSAPSQPVQSQPVQSQPAPSPDSEIIFEIPSYTNRPSWNATLNDNTFRSLLEVRYAPQTNRLWVVNELKLEQYLKGIAETSNSSPYEYQKTLITAARTYAKYHIDRSTKHAADGFTVSPTEADQVYRGYGAEKRLPHVSRAVDETRGVIVTYGGKIAITPYYSQSDGRTRSWEEVWGGSPKPWLVGKPDPYSAGLPMLGHGVGMSARGAIGMALDNKPFEEILKYYYTGIELRRIY
jgi:hypothetical protein